MKMYMVLYKKGDTIEYRIGGGSSSPAIPRVYDSLKMAQSYIRNMGLEYYIVEIDTDKLETV